MAVDSAPNRVQVFARVRPEAAHMRTCVQTSEEARTVHVSEAVNTHDFVFDGVFLPQATQEEVFMKVGFPVVHEYLKGFNGSILAYGQTGSGKTHSILHQGENLGDAGLLPRVVAEIFNHITEDPENSYKVEAAAMQVYNEQLDDLLHPHHKSGDGDNLIVQNGGDVAGLTWVPCRSAGELTHTFSRARTNLVYAETKMNKVSSRSHAVFQIKLTKHGQSDVTYSKLSIVDLAGSERVKKSGAEGVQFKEATAINKSLLAFGNVVSALAAKKSHVPFRDSKLTHALSAYMGGNCKTSLLVCSSPAEEHVAETLCSLEFASRAMQIEVHARMNRMSASNSGVAVHECFTGIQDIELASAHEIVAEAIARAQEAQIQLEVANEATLQALAREEQAEARAQVAEQRASQWKSQCEELMQYIESLEAKLAGRAHLCPTTAAFEKLEMRIAAARASRVAEEPSIALADVADGKAELVCNDCDAQPMSLELELNYAGHESSQGAGSVLCKNHEQQPLEDAEHDAMSCTNLPEKHDFEKQGVATRPKHGQQQHQEFEFQSRCVRNCILGSTPPPLQLKTSSVKSMSFSKLLVNDQGEHCKTRSSLKSSGILDKEAFGGTHDIRRSRTPTPSRPRLQANAWREV